MNKSDEQTIVSIDYSYKHCPTIWKFANDNSRWRLLMGPVGSGKSSGCVWEIIRRALAQAPSPVDGIRRTRWLVLRQTYRQLLDTTIKTFFDWLPPAYFGEWRVAEHVYKITAFENTHIEVLFRALDSPEHVSNLLSLEITGAWINEAKEVAEPIVDMIDTRIGRYPSKKHGGCTWMGIFMDTNPPDEDSWLYKKFELIKPPNAKVFKQPSGLSPEAENLPNLPENYYQNLSEGKSPDFIRVYVEGQYGRVKSGKSVYSGYNDNLHVSKTPLNPLISEPLILGLDFGLQVAAVICQVTPRGRFFVLDELTSENMGIKNFIANKLTPLLNTKYHGYTVIGYGDPAGVQRAQTDERTCFEELHYAGYKIHPARTNALAARIDAVESLLSRLVDGEPCFQMDPSCRILRQGFNGGYHFREIAGFSGKYSDMPAKNKFSHVHDALQYAAMYVTERQNSQKRASLIIPKKHYTVSVTGY